MTSQQQLHLPQQLQEKSLNVFGSMLGETFEHFQIVMPATS